MSEKKIFNFPGFKKVSNRVYELQQQLQLEKFNEMTENERIQKEEENAERRERFENARTELRARVNARLAERENNPQERE